MVESAKLEIAKGWILRMRWEELLFAHWPVPCMALAGLLPRGLELDTFDGMAWIGVVPFRMEGFGCRFLPGIPGTKAFSELNVRTYVRHNDRAGVWFFSLDATHPLAVRAARRIYHLPYRHARIQIRHQSGHIEYSSDRTERGVPAAQLAVRYRATGPISLSSPGSIDFWLTERYALFSANRLGILFEGRIAHRRWPLQPAEADFRLNTMTEGIGLRLPDCPPLLHYANSTEVRAWPLSRVAFTG